VCGIIIHGCGLSLRGSFNSSYCQGDDIARLSGTIRVDVKDVPMATRSAIEWTEMTWNPVTGCSKVSPGCANCYAERMSRRLHAMGATRYANGFELTTHADAQDAPLHWKAPRKVFVNSMSDRFHKDVPLEFIQRVFDVIAISREALTDYCRRTPGFMSPRIAS
jgi:hypothetical protein